MLRRNNVFDIAKKKNVDKCIICRNLRAEIDNNKNILLK